MAINLYSGSMPDLLPNILDIWAASNGRPVTAHEFDYFDCV